MPQAPAAEQGGDVGKLIEGVGMGLQKLAEMLPPELAGKMGELVAEYQSILSGGGEESEEPEEAPAAPMGGKMDMMGGKSGRPVY